MLLTILTLIIDHGFKPEATYAIAPAVAAAIISAAPALLQLGQGIAQGGRAGKIKGNRPMYGTPNEILQNEKDAKAAYNASTAYGLPGQGRIQNNFMQGQANTLNAIKQSQQTPAAQLIGIAASDANTKNSMADLGVNAAQMRQQNMDNARMGLISARQALAAYRDREFEINRMKPFTDAMAAKGALRGAAQQNIYGGVASLANTAGNYNAANGGFKNKPVATTGIVTDSGTGAAAQGREAIIDALMNTPEYSGMSREEVASIVYGNK